jgi:hypothetical protein
MNSDSKQVGLPRTFADYHGPANRNGVRYVASSQSGGAARLCVLCSIYPANFPARARAVFRRDPLPAPSHRHRYVAGRRAAGQGTLVRFPSRAVLPRLVLLAAGQGVVRVGAGIDSLGSADHLSGGRHDAAAQRQEGLRQRVSSRCLPLDAQPRGLGLGTQVDDAGDQREVPLRLAALGVAGTVRALSAGEVESIGAPAAQEAHRPGDAVDGRTDPLVSREKVHSSGGRRATPATSWRGSVTGTGGT